jgi:hypothetical protein
MQVKQLIALSALALAGTAALADDITIDNTPFVSTRSRAEVKADVQQARAHGELLAAGEGDAATSAERGTSTLARSAVKAEVLQARAGGQLLPAGERLAAENLPRRVKRAQPSDTLAQAR